MFTFEPDGIEDRKMTLSQGPSALVFAGFLSDGVSVLLVEQNFNFAATVADRHYVMEHGRIVDEFSTPELKANMGKLHEYLGV